MIKMKYDAETKLAFEKGKSDDAYKFMGCQFDRTQKTASFRVWAPGALEVSVVGDFNDWDFSVSPMEKVSFDGVWEARVKNVGEYDNYKFYLKTAKAELYKSDPYAFHSETHDATASKVYDLSGFKFSDADYLDKRNKKNIYASPINIYECHMGSWQKNSDGGVLSYRAFADKIAPYLTEMRYTHLELMGIAEYPFDGSWGYQVTGYYAPTSRYGTPEDFAYLVDKLHSSGLGIIIDWVPGHFPKNGNGLYEFDGAPLYEPSDELRKEHKEWGTRCFDYKRGEVKSFLVSNALYWLDIYHVDGLRVDAVASMLYLDYGRKEWRPNERGGHENYDAVEFFRDLNTAVFKSYPNALMIAEESTAWPKVTKPVDKGGLGFNFKWNMGWMNDSLTYAKTDPLFRAGLHNNLTFTMSYTFSENYILPVSHDEVVYGKCSLVNKMPGTYEQKFAGFRNYMMYMYAHPGKKLVFMGTEFAQYGEWNFAKGLEWKLLDGEPHLSAKEFVRKLNAIYADYKPLHEIEDSWQGFEWLVADDSKQNVIAFERRDKTGNRMIFIINFSLCKWSNYRIGVNEGKFKRILMSDVYGWNDDEVIIKSEKEESHGKSHSIALDIEAMSGYCFTAPPYKKKENPTAAKTETKSGAPTAKKTKAKEKS